MAFSFNKNSHSSYQPMSEINVTPFVDVMLVLLVIFMVTAPMMMQGMDVNLPETSAPPVERSDEKMVLSLTKDKRIYLGEAEIDRERLLEVLGSNARLKKDKEILLNADQGLSYGFVVEVMSELRKAGVVNINMVTNPKGKA